MRFVSLRPALLCASSVLLLCGVSSTLQQAKAWDLTSNSSSQQTLSGSTTGTVESGVSLSTTGSTIAVYWSGASTSSSLTNYGTITTTGSGRAFDTNNATFNSGAFTINNMTGATLSTSGTKDAIRVDGSKVTITGAFVINNYGTIAQTNSTFSVQATAIDLHKITSLGAGGSITLNNYATGVISSANYDAIEPGTGMVINNWGTITSTGGPNTKAPSTLSNKLSAADGIDIADGISGVTVNNYAGGTISGARHGVTQGTLTTNTTAATLTASEWTTLSDLTKSVIVTNSGTITGRNGSGVGSDASGTVTNYGTITGTYAGNGNVYYASSSAQTYTNTGDGDGVDIDFLAKIINYGTIQGTGASGIDSTGNANVSEGLSIGGGTVYNAKGALISGAGRGITVTGNDISTTSTDKAYYVTTITNEGTIQGLGLTSGGGGGSAIRLYSDFANTIINSSTGQISGAGSEAAIWVIGTGANTITNAGTITQTGTGPAIQFSDTGSTVSNSGTISGGTYGIYATSGGTNITTSGTISGGTGAIYFGAGGNTLTISSGARFGGAVYYNNTTGNTLAFGSGSYALAVNQYAAVGNTITLNNNGQIVLTGTLNGSGTGTIQVVDGRTVTSGTAQQGSDVARAVSSVVGDVMSADNPSGAPQPASLQDSPLNKRLLQQVQDEFAARPDKQLAQLNPTAFSPDIEQGLISDGYGNMVWSRGFGGLRYTPASANAAAVNASHLGLAVGYDRKTDFGRFGVFAGGGGLSSYAADGSGSLNGSFYFAGLAARYEAGLWFADAEMTAGYISNRTIRRIGGSGDAASASFGGVFLAPELALGYRYALAPDWTLTPTLRGRYAGTFYDGYTETGSSQNMSVNGSSVHLFEERAELRLTNTHSVVPGLPSQIYVQGGFFGQHRLGDDSLSASLQGVSFVLPSTNARDLFGASVGLGFDAKLSRNVNLYAGGDTAFYSNAGIAISARSGIKVSF